MAKDKNDSQIIRDRGVVLKIPLVTLSEKFRIILSMIVLSTGFCVSLVLHFAHVNTGGDTPLSSD